MNIAQLALKIITTLGVPGVFIGLIIEFLGIPFPGEVMLLFTGFLVWQGQLDLSAVIVAAATGSWIGSLLAYFVGKHLGRPVLLKYGRYVMVTPRKVKWVQKWFNKYQIGTLIFGRFVPGVRPLSSYLAGIAKIKLYSFAFFSLLGATLWVASFILLGRYMGQNWILIIALLKKYTWIVISLVIIIAGYYFLRKSIIKGG